MLSPVEEIKSRLDVVEVIQGYLKLQKAGSNWKGLCPFHSEKTPSFMVTPARQMWHCFGCAQGGDVFAFVGKMEGLEFGDTLRLLADKAGVKLSRQDPQIQSKRKRIYEVCELAARFFQRQLISNTGQAAVRYLTERGVSQESVKNFGIGWAPDTWQSLRNFLNGEGYTDPEMMAGGLVVQSEDSKDYHDRFRHRIMFPIGDSNGQVIGFSGRLFDKIKAKTAHADAGKYINTPNTLLYDKSRALYGLDKAKLAIRQSNNCVLVEGNLDVVMSHQAGVNNAVAPCGTAFSQEHFRIIKRYSDHLLLAFDADEAGEAALKRSVAMALASGFSVMAVATPFGKDAADAVKENPKLWQEAVASPAPYIGLILKKSLEKFKLGTLEAKKAVALAVLPFIKSVASPLERDHWLGELSLKIGVEKNILVSELKSVQVYGVEGTGVANSDNFSKKTAGTEQSARIKQEEYLVALLSRYPELKKLITEDDLIILSQPGMMAAVRVIMDGGEVRVGEISDSAMLAGDFLDEFVVEPQSEFLKILANLRKQYIQSRLKIIQTDMSKAEMESDSANLELLKVEFNELSKKLNG